MMDGLGLLKVKQRELVSNHSLDQSNVYKESIKSFSSERELSVESFYTLDYIIL